MTKDTLFFFITNQCNLKCKNCSQNCDNENNNYCLSFIDFKKNITLIKDKHVTLNHSSDFTINFIGGEPFLNPDLKAMVELTKQLYPHATIIIATNGLLLNHLSDKELLYYGKYLNITFEVSIYPNLSLLNYYQRLEERFTILGLNNNLHFGNSHIYFYKYTATKNINPEDIKKISCNQLRNNQSSSVIIYKNKIITCWGSVSWNIFTNEKTLNNYCDIEDLQLNDDLYQFKNKNICINCANTFGNELTLWQQVHQTNTALTNIPLKDLYLFHYDEYYQLEHNCHTHYQALKNPFFINHFTDYVSGEFLTVNNRFLNGLCDIFIPIENKCSKEFYDLLIAQNQITNCAIYIIDFSQNADIESFNYEMFNPTQQLNKGFTFFFLKATDVYSSYLTFMHNSYNQQKICLNTNDYLQLKNSNHILNQLPYESQNYLKHY